MVDRNFNGRQKFVRKSIEIDTLDMYAERRVYHDQVDYLFTVRRRLFHRPLSITQHGANGQTSEKWQSHSAFHYVFKERCVDVDVILIYN